MAQVSEQVAPFTAADYAERGEKLIEAFSGMFLSPRYDQTKPTPNFAREVWNLYASNAKQCAIAAPRNHSKSTSFTHAYILTECLFRYQSYVMLLGASEEMAIEHLGDIAIELRDNEELTAAFGIKKLDTDAKTDIICRMKDGHAFRIVARGAEQKIRGRKWNGMRPGLIVCHAPCTPIYDYDIGAWMLNDDHPTARQVEADCFEISLALLEDDAHNEVVSADHFYLVKRNISSDPEWVKAKDLRAGDFIGDVHDDGAQKRIHAKVAGSARRAVARAEPYSECGVSKTAQRKIVRAPQSVGHGKSEERQAIEAGLLPPAQVRDGRESRCVCEKEQGKISKALYCAPKFDGNCNAQVGGYRENQTVLSPSESVGSFGGSHCSVEIEAGLRTALHEQPSNDYSIGELEKEQHVLARHAVGIFYADGFIWRPVNSTVAVGRRSVVAIKTKSGFYKTKFGMSHNCDDL